MSKLEQPGVRAYCAAGLGVLIALPLSLAVGWMVYVACPLSDPLDVVGLPLWKGYSEKVEQFALLGWWLAALGLPIIIYSFAKCLPSRWLGILGPLAFCGIGLYEECWFQEANMLILLVIGSSSLVWRIWPKKRRTIVACTVLLSCVCLVQSAFERGLHNTVTLSFSVLSMTQKIGGITLGTLLVVIVGRVICRWLSRKGKVALPIIWCLAVLLCLLVAKTLEIYFFLGGLCLGIAVAIPLGLPGLKAVATGYEQRPVVMRILMFAFAGVFLGWALHQYLHMPTYRWPLAGSYLMLGVISSRFPDVVSMQRLALGARYWESVIRNRLRRCSASTRRAVDFLRDYWHFLLVAPLVVIKPWFAVMTMCALLCCSIPRRRRPGWSRIILASLVFVLLALAFLPHLATPYPNPDLDVFHHGQILSAVWEYQSGRAGYTEVFPLRGLYFYLNLWQPLLLPPSLQAYEFAHATLYFLAVPACFSLAYAWTRRLPWSIATGLFAGTLDIHQFRQAILLLFAAWAVSALRSDRLVAWIALALPAIAAGFFGFDGIGVFVPALVVAAFVAPPSLMFREKQLGGLLHRSVAAGLVGLWCLLAFSVALTWTDGGEAALTYWRLFLDFAKNVNAFYGIPIKATTLFDHRYVIEGFLLMGLWAAVGPLMWRHWSKARLRQWTFLAVFMFLVVQRSIGRTAYPHTFSWVYASTVFMSLLLFELVYVGRVLRILTRPNRRRNLVLVACACLLWMTDYGNGSPQNFFAAYRSLAPQESQKMPRSKWLLERVGPDEYFWPIENGIATYVHRRHNPTRHAIAYAMSTPHEQYVSVQDLRRHEPKVIQWPTIAMDGIAVPLRYYIIAPHLYRYFRPSEQPGYLERAPDDWDGQNDIAESFRFEVPMRRIPHTWGQHRIHEITAATEGVPVKFQFDAGDDALDSPGADASCTLNSRRLNYLVFRIAIRSETGAEFSTVRLHFAEEGKDYRPLDSLTFDVCCDSQEAAYVVPVGVCPGWSWRPKISRMRLELPEDVVLERLECESFEFDELSRFE